MKNYKTKTIEETDLVCNLLRTRYPKCKINIDYNYNSKEYSISCDEKKICDEKELEIPIDLTIKVIYGDSVTGDTPILLRNPLTKKIKITQIDKIYDDKSFREYSEFKLFDNTSVRLEKQFAFSEYEIWSDTNWTPIRKIIRHKTDKQIFRIVTTSGIVDVTEDHSLLYPNLVQVKPQDLKIGDKLLTNSNFLKESKESEYDSSSLESSKIIGQEISSEISSQIEIPEYVLNGSKEIKESFLTGYLEGKYSYVFTEHNKVEMMGMYYILKTLGFDIGFSMENKGYYNFFSGNNSEGEVTKIIKLNCNDIDNYVYDIETESGRFCAGIGSVIVKNTDSIFLSFNYNREDKKSNRYDTFRLAELCGEKLTNEVFNRHPIEMEFENVKSPLILIAKKHYIGKKFEDKKNPLKSKGKDVKGVAMTKRNYCKMVKRCYSDIIDTVLESDFNGEITMNKIVDIITSYLKKIEKYDIDIDDLIITASLAKSYKSENLPHVNLAKRLKERKEEVQVGDRIPFVFVENFDQKVKKFEKAEDPKWIKEHNLPFDRSCYLDQLSKPILSLLEIVMSEYPSHLNKVKELVNSTTIRCSKPN